MANKIDDQFEQKRRFLANVPEVYKNIFERAFAGTSIRQAINAKCLECMNFQRNEIKNCPMIDCPLWAVRPYQERGVPTQKPPVTGGFSEEQPKLDLIYG